MSLLDEIIEGASGDTVGVSTLLRKLMVVAARADAEILEGWVEHELTGYPADADLPAYRGPFQVEVLGHFSGPFGSALKNAALPRLSFPEDFREGGLFNQVFTEPIAELEQLADANAPLESRWPADAVAYTNTLIQVGDVQLYDGMGLQQAWKVISPSHLSGMTDAVRTRILDLALSIEKVVPDFGEPGAAKPDPERLNQVVNNHIYGSANIAVGGSDFQQTINLPHQGDTAELLEVLANLGVADPWADTLKDAIEADSASGEGEIGRSVGTRVRDWLSRFALDSASSAGKSAGSSIGAQVGKAILSYYGVDAP